MYASTTGGLSGSYKLCFGALRWFYFMSPKAKPAAKVAAAPSRGVMFARDHSLMFSHRRCPLWTEQGLFSNTLAAIRMCRPASPTTNYDVGSG